ncbi:MAG: DUF2971 domain-containing protein [Motiliproteus sp.]
MTEMFVELIVDLEDSLEKISTKISNRNKITDVPDELYHYTSAEGIIGIIESDSMWATDVSYLNDSSEVKHSLRVFENIILDKEKEPLSDVAMEFLNQAKQNFNPFIGAFTPYILCFCCDNDLLSQWRGYANSGGGYCIGLSGQAINRSSINNVDPRKFKLIPVVYDENRQYDEMKELLDDICNSLDKITHGISPSLGMAAILSCLCELKYHLSTMLCTYKNNSFSEENEWRLIFIERSSYSKGTKIRSGQFGLVPYVPIRLVAKNTSQLKHTPITSVMIGPTIKDKQQIRPLNLLLNNNDFSSHHTGYKWRGVHINVSKIPLRY